MILFYILKDKKPVPVTDAMEAEAFLRSGDRVVRRDDINGIRISTVFLAIDHGFDRGLPVLFETMIFGGEHDDYQERYTSWEEAEEGHERAVEMVKASIKTI